MSAATPEIALVAKLKAGSTDAGARIYPQINTQGPVLPLVIVTRQSVEGGARLNGSSRALKQYMIEVDCYASSQAGAMNLAAQVLVILAPDGSPWRDLPNGVQGCFFVDSGEQVVDDETKDTPRLVRETYTVWHTPT